MKDEIQRQFLENRFVGMSAILIVAAIALFSGYVNEETWKTTSLFALAIFSGSKVFDSTILANRTATAKDK